jgi:acylphosphatase
MSPVRRRVLVSGRVQGVFFREGCRERAEAAGVSGWARNRGDGRFEACLEGNEDAVTRVVEWCRRGPSAAQVETVDVSDEEPQGETGFRVKG